MNKKIPPKLNPKKRYLQIALNNTLTEAKRIIEQLPTDERIIVEAGTPLIKRYGEEGIRLIKDWYTRHLTGQSLTGTMPVAQPGTPFPPFVQEVARLFKK
jgi:hypothetical protein